MLCRKCKKEMLFLAEFEKVALSMLPNKEALPGFLNSQIVMCENCRTPYIYQLKDNVLTLITLSKSYMEKQPKEVQRNIKFSVRSLTKNIKQLQLVREWMRDLQDEE